MTDLLAVDAGGTSTRAIIVTADGECRGYGRAGSGNPISAGSDHAAGEVVAAVRAALDGAGSPRIGGIGVFAMAGASTHVAMGRVIAELEEAGVHADLELESDLLATFCSGAWEPDGYAVVAGTGAAAIRVRQGRQDAVADGLGWLLGDAGSGFWIGRRVVRAVAADLDGRGPATPLTGMLLDELGIHGDAGSAVAGRPNALRDLVEAVYGRRPIDLATFAPLAFASDDPVAAAIRAGARQALRAALDAVRDPEVTGPVVAGGSVLGALGSVDDVSSPIGPVRGVPDGAVGAAVLALRANGVTVDRRVFERVTASLRLLRG
jgi:glucosamine kinase